MATYDFLYSTSTAKTIINNFKNQTRMYCEQVAEMKQYRVLYPHGVLRREHMLYDQIDIYVNTYGIRITGTALNEAWSTVDIGEVWLYYDTSDYEDLQSEWVDELIRVLDEVADELKRNVEELKEEVKEEEERRKQEVKAIKEEYKRLRKSIKAKAKRRGKEISLPAIPKTITKGSIRKLQSISKKL